MELFRIYLAITPAKVTITTAANKITINVFVTLRKTSQIFVMYSLLLC